MLKLQNVLVSQKRLERLNSVTGEVEQGFKHNIKITDLESANAIGKFYLTHQPLQRLFSETVAEGETIVTINTKSRVPILYTESGEQIVDEARYLGAIIVDVIEITFTDESGQERKGNSLKILAGVMSERLPSRHEVALQSLMNDNVQIGASDTEFIEGTNWSPTD